MKATALFIGMLLTTVAHAESVWQPTDDHKERYEHRFEERKTKHHGDSDKHNKHVKESNRGQGIGTLMVEWALEEARRRRCRRVQLTSNKLRVEAHGFYRRLGFEFSHEGAKLYLDPID